MIGGGRRRLKVLSVAIHLFLRHLSCGVVGMRICAGERVQIQANARARALIHPEAEVNDDEPLCVVFFSL